MKTAYKILIFKETKSLNAALYADCRKAFKELGCETMEIPEDSAPKDVAEILTTLKPDCVFTLNYAGINENVLSQIKVPCLCWFIDNPLFFLTESSPSPQTVFFVIEETYVPLLKKYGFRNVFYLPPAANPERMHTSEREDYPPMDISFAEPLGKRYTEWREERNATAKSPVKEILDLLVHMKMQKPSASFDRMFRFCDEKFKTDVLQKLDMKSRGSFEFRIDIESTAYFKETYLLALRGSPVYVFGDAAWKKVLPDSYRIFDRFEYDLEAAAVYRVSKVNVNVIPAWIQTGVNQRLLDIAATGSLFLTNKRDRIQDFFDCDIRHLMFSSETELREKTDYFLKNDDVRIMVGNELFESVYKRHTARRRMQEMLEIFAGIKG